jgi:hypothetical protein
MMATSACSPRECRSAGLIKKLLAGTFGQA